MSKLTPVTWTQWNEKAQRYDLECAHFLTRDNALEFADMLSRDYNSEAIGYLLVGDARGQGDPVQSFFKAWDSHVCSKRVMRYE